MKVSLRDEHYRHLTICPQKEGLGNKHESPKYMVTFPPLAIKTGNKQAKFLVPVRKIRLKFTETVEETLAYK